MEPMRGVKPRQNFLRQVKSIAKNKAILIFDEITSGFKDNYGGLHLKLKVILILQFLENLSKMDIQFSNY